MTYNKFEVGKCGLDSLAKNLILYFTGITRNASEVLSKHKLAIENGDKKIRLKFEKNHSFSIQFEKYLTKGDFDSYGSLLNEYWQNKKSMSSNTTSRDIDSMYEVALANSALGGKIIGAGGGGFLLLYTIDYEKKVNAMEKYKLKKIDFNFSNQGVELLDV